MAIDCGSQIILCDLPIRFDTYKGCTHGCKYCFAQRKTDLLADLKPNGTVNELINFINGKRGQKTNWCDWDIPLHWGGMSDPFQPIEAKYKISLECLKILAETKYPFVVSTKGKLLATDEYLNVLKDCNAVVQISMVCDKYDKLEKGAPTYQERLEMCKKISPVCKRLIVRVQPYMREILPDLLENLPKLKEAGVYGITVEGMKFVKTKQGLEKLAGDYVYPMEALRHDFEIIKEKCHENGLAFFSAENRLREMGDGMCCCGIEGLEGFRTNTFNICHLLNGCMGEPTEKMSEPKTSKCFGAMYQSTAKGKVYDTASFKDAMLGEYKFNEKSMKKIFGKK